MVGGLGLGRLFDYLFIICDYLLSLLFVIHHLEVRVKCKGQGCRVKGVVCGVWFVVCGLWCVVCGE